MTVAAKPDMRRGGGDPVPWPVSTVKPRLSVPTPVFDKLVERASVEDVKLDELVATQPTIDPKELQRFERELPDVPKGKRNPRGLLIDTPIVYRRDGEDRIYDGHHRLAAARARGEATAKARYVDLDAFRSSDNAIRRWVASR